MKQLLIFICFLSLAWQGKAQTQVYNISGNISNLQMPIPVQLTFYDYQNNIPIDTVVNTDALGNINIALALPSTIDPIVYATFNDCYGATQNTAGILDIASLTGIVGADFCPTSTPFCFAYFYAYQSLPFVDPLVFNFENQSSWTATADFLWDFGDGTTLHSSDFNISHTFPAWGVYNVCLTITDTAAGGCTTTYCNAYSVNPSGANCAAQWWGGVTDPNNPQMVSLTNASTPSSTATFVWDFGDGNTLSSNQQNITYTYLQPGAYNICLTISDSACYNTYCEVLHVNVVQNTCHSSFSYSQPDLNNNPNWLQFSNISWNTDTNTVYTWYFDTTVVVSNSPVVDFTFPNTGVGYNVCLNISNGTTCNDTYCDVVYLALPYSVCNAYFYSYPTMGYSLNTTFYNFSFPFMFPPFSSTATYAWDFGDGDTATSTQQNIEHFYASPGFYNVCLTVSDSNCQQSYCQYIEAGNLQAATCLAGISWYQIDPYNNPQAVNFSNTSVNFDINNTTFFWDFGDGTTSTDANPYHVYADTGNYLVSLTMNYNGCTDTRLDIINIYSWGVACQASFYVVQDTSNFVLQIIHNSQGYGLLYNWDFGDGTSSSDPYPMHSYSAPGSYVLCLNAFDLLLGCNSYFCDTIVIDSNGFALRGGSPYVLQVLPPSNGSDVLQSITDTDIPTINWQLFPNPVETELTLACSMPTSGALRLGVINALGQEVLVENMQIGAGEFNHQLSVQSLPAGAYWVRAALNGQSPQVFKFVKIAQ